MKRFNKVLCALIAAALLAGLLPATALAAIPAYNSVLVSSTIPATMVAGVTYRVTVTFRNTGRSSWTSAGGYRMKALGGSDPFTATTAYAVGTTAIRTNQSKTFTVTMKAPARAGTYTTDWRMFRGSTAFGATLTRRVTVVPVALSSIAVTRQPAKLTYYVGDALNLSGMVVTGTYNNGTKKVLPITSANITGFTTATPATGRIVTVSYGGKRTTFKINVLAVALSSIAVTAQPAKLNYYVGDAMNLSGLVVTGTYNNGTKKVLPITSANITGFTTATPATGRIVTVSYGGKTTTYKINVLAVALSSIDITTQPTKTNYYVGDTLDLTGMVVTGTYNNGTKKVLPITAANVNGFDSSVPTTGQVLIVTYGGKTTAFTINVLFVTLQSIAVTAQPAKLTYYVGDMLDLTGLVVTGTNNNGTKKVLPITAVNISGFTTATPATGRVVTVTYGGKTTTFTINVLALELQSIAITTLPNKLTYYTGDTLNLAGLVVTGSYNSGSMLPLSIIPANVTGFDSSAPATGQVLTISYGGKTASFTINVLALQLSSIAVRMPPAKLTYFVGEPLDLTGLIVLGTFNSGMTNPLPILPDNISGFDSSKPATGQVLTVTFAGKTATFTVDILPPPVLLPLPTFGIKNNKVCQEYQLTVGSSMIDVSSANMLSITVLTPTGPQPLTPTEDTNLWIDVQTISLPYVYSFVSKSGIVYNGVPLPPPPSPTVTAVATGAAPRTDASGVYQEYQLGSMNLSGIVVFEIRPDGTAIQRPVNSDANLWFAVNSPAGTYTFLIPQGPLYITATITVP